MVVLTLVASAINYGSNVIFSHVLDPAGYGELTALFALSSCSRSRPVRRRR